MWWTPTLLLVTLRLCSWLVFWWQWFQIFPLLNNLKKKERKKQRTKQTDCSIYRWLVRWPSGQFLDSIGYRGDQILGQYSKVWLCQTRPFQMLGLAFIHCFIWVYPFLWRCLWSSNLEVQGTIGHVPFQPVPLCITASAVSLDGPHQSTHFLPHVCYKWRTPVAERREEFIFPFVFFLLAGQM